MFKVRYDKEVLQRRKKIDWAKWNILLDIIILPHKILFKFKKLITYNVLCNIT